MTESMGLKARAVESLRSGQKPRFLPQFTLLLPFPIPRQVTGSLFSYGGGGREKRVRGREKWREGRCGEEEGLVTLILVIVVLGTEAADTVDSGATLKTGRLRVWLYTDILPQLLLLQGSEISSSQVYSL